MSYPTDRPVRRQIIDNVVSTLEAIVAGPTYRTEVERVFVMGRNVFNVNEYPSILVGPSSQKMSDSRHPMITSTLSFFMSLAISEGDDDEAMNDMYDFVEDVKLALHADRTRGGYAVDTHVRSDEPYIPDVSKPLYGADLLVEIDYRHRISDPSQAL